LSKVDGVDAGSCHNYEQNGGLAKHDDLFEDFDVLFFSRCNWQIGMLRAR
jgi:hypothetical protein